MARLLTKLKRIERERRINEAAAEAAAARTRPVGLLWRHCETEIDVETLRPGEEIVRDYTIHSKGHGSTHATARERITTGPDDHGDVYNDANEKIGRVCSDDGGIVELDYEETRLHVKKQHAEQACS